MNSNDEEVIHHIHCFRYIFFLQIKTMLVLFDFYSESYLSNVLNSFYSTKHLYIHFGLLPQQHIY